MTPREQWKLTYRLYRALMYRNVPTSGKLPGKFAAACDYAYLSRGDKLAGRLPGYMLKSRRPMVSPVYIGPIFNCRCSTKPL
jgi:hypothetical protein